MFQQGQRKGHSKQYIAPLIWIIQLQNHSFELKDTLEGIMVQYDTCNTIN